MQRTNQQKIPILLFLLNQCKFHEILKFPNPYCNSMVKSSLYSVVRKNLKQINLLKDSLCFKQQLIQLKGSSQYNCKQYKNTVLQEMIRRKLLTQNIDPQTRMALWLQLSQFYSKKNLYLDLKILQITPDFAETILKDIKRTFKSQQIRSQTQQVLQFFAQYNPYVGYCQGMNNIVAFILSKGYNCQQAFLIFKKITQEKLPCDYYTKMDNIMAYTRIFYEILNITHPQIYAHLKKLSHQFENAYVVMVSFVLQWFVCLFCNDNICEEITEVIWDFFLLDGISVLFKAAIAIFDLLKQSILRCNNFEQYNFMQKQCIKKIKNVQYIRKRITEIYMCPKILQLLKQKLIQPQNQQKSSSDIQKKDKKMDRSMLKKPCNRKLNVCVQTLDDNLNQNKTFQIFVFRPNTQIKIIPNYLQTLHKQYFKNDKKKSKIDCLMIGRIPHTCRNSCDSVTDDSFTEKNHNQQQMLKSPNKKNIETTPKSNKTNLSINEQQLRDKLSRKIYELSQQKPQVRRSQSVAFMQQMIKNGSISNLLQLYDIDQLFQ